MNTYHPDPEINEGLQQETAEAERVDMAAGFPPRWWRCPECGKSHNRGHVNAIGVHRCLKCGYTGDGGIMSELREELYDKPKLASGEEKV